MMNLWKILFSFLILVIPYMPSYALTNEKNIGLHDLFSIENPNDDLSNIMSSGGSLTITGSGTIHFIQIFFYSDSSCSTLLGGASAIDNVTGMAFSSGQTVNINSNSAYQLANNQGIITGNIRCMKVYLTGGNQSSNGISCQSFTDEACSGTSCTSSQTKLVGWGSSPSACERQYAYVANVANNTVTKCTVNTTTGALFSCASTGGGFNGTVPGVSIINGYGYLSLISTNTISVCTASASDGSFSNCSSSTSITAPGQNTINAKYAYFPSLTSNYVTRCIISPSTGALSSCTIAASNLINPQGIAINNGYAYVTNSQNSMINLCAVSTSDGSLSSCASTGSGFNNPRGIALNNGYAYSTNSGNNSVLKCTINSFDGSLSSCIATGSGFSNPRGVYINNGYAYVTNVTGNTVSKCAVNSIDGSFSACGSTGSDFSGPRQITIF